MIFFTGWSRERLLPTSSETVYAICFPNQLLLRKLIQPGPRCCWIFPEIRVELLKKLRADFRIYLFSNTNAIHVAKYHANFRNQHGFEVFALFEKNFYSNEIGYRKPSLESFQKIIRLSGIQPEESLFIDDSLSNIEGARATGLKGYWLEPGQKIEELFQKYL